MTPLNSGNVLRLPLADIHVRQRLRPVNRAAVENLILMAEDTGITTPIHVRKVKGAWQLIDGAHRLEAARRMGMTEIACLAVECREDEARAMEASNNLGACRMTPLQTAVFVASWKKDYYALHPDRKPGVFKGNRHTGSLVGAEAALTTAICQAFAIKERRAYRMLAVGERLTVAEIGLLERTERNLALDELEALSKVSDPEERLSVVKTLAADPKARVGRVLAAIQAKNAPETPPKDPVEGALEALRDAWSRAPMAARRRFVEAEGAVLGQLLNDLHYGDDGEDDE